MSEFQRKNGFSWPLDYRQVISWLFVIYIGLMLFGTLTISVIQPWSYLIGIVSIYLFKNLNYRKRLRNFKVMV
jgi:hypothetical protein